MVYMRSAFRYMGHSWASGLQISADGKNQESSSEAVNAYVALVELGRATGDAVLEGWGQVLLSSELTAVRKYTQVYTGNDLYQEVSSQASVSMLFIRSSQQQQQQ